MPARNSAARFRAQQRQRAYSRLEELIGASRAAHAGIAAALSMSMVDSGDAYALLQLVDEAFVDAAEQVRDALDLGPAA